MYAALFVARITTIAAIVVSCLCVIADGPPKKLMDDACRAVVGGCFVDGTSECPTIPDGKDTCGATECTGSQDPEEATCPSTAVGYAQVLTSFANAYDSSTSAGKNDEKNEPEVYCWTQAHCRNGCRKSGAKVVCKTPEASQTGDFYGESSKATPTVPDPNSGNCLPGGGG